MTHWPSLLNKLEDFETWAYLMYSVDPSPPRPVLEYLGSGEVICYCFVLLRTWLHRLSSLGHLHVKHTPSHTGKLVWCGVLLCNIPFSRLKINMVSTVVFRLQLSFSLSSFLSSHPGAVCTKGWAWEQSGYSFCLFSKWISLQLEIAFCKVEWEMGQGSWKHLSVDCGRKFLNMEVALLS